MSATYNWARNQKTGDPLSKLVLLVIADHAGDYGLCLLSIKEIAKECECHDATVRRRLHDLKNLGLVHLEEEIGRPYLISLVGFPHHKCLTSGGADNVCTN